MVAEARTWVDVEGAVRSWARDSIDLIGRRAFFGYSAGAARVGAQVVLTRLGGPDDEALFQFDCWASTKEATAVLAAEVASEADALARYVSGETLLHGAVVESIRWVPDPVSDAPRHVVDVTFTATAAS